MSVPKLRLTEYGATLEQQLSYLVEFRDRMRSGMINQKVAGREAIDLLEVYPALELQATVEMLKIAYKAIEEQEEPQKLPEITVSYLDGNKAA